MKEMIVLSANDCKTKKIGVFSDAFDEGPHRGKYVWELVEYTTNGRL
jgi:hypothetical protein